MAVKQTNLKLVVAGLLLGILVASMDNTIVATAMGSIVADLGGLEKFIWVTSAYMAAEMAGMPIFGKLSDMYGRKRFFIFGLVVFLAGSMLCGTAQSIVQLSIYRAIQGIGGGALVPIAFTIVFDVFPPEKRGKMGGLFGAVFGLSSIFGPLLGAYITDYIDWRWCFYINLPLGLAAFLLVAGSYHESPVHTKQRIDWWGAFTLVGAVVCLMFALELGGSTYAWDSAPILLLFAGFTLLTVLFLIIERYAAEPVISYSMFRNRLFAASTLVSLFYGAAFIAATVYLPIFIQGVQGGTATNSGLILLPMMLGVVFSAQSGGFMANKMSYRTVMLPFVLIFITGVALLCTLDTDTTKLQVTLYMIVTGFGIGASFSVIGMAAIHPFDVSQRGSANSTMAFVRSLGMTIGITVFGILQRNDFTDRLQSAFIGSGSGGGAAVASPQGGFPTDPRKLMSEEGRAAFPAPLLDKVVHALSTSITHTFLWTLIPAVLALIGILAMGSARLIVHQPSAAVAPAEPKQQSGTL